MNASSILIIYTGGTIGMVADESNVLKPFNLKYIHEAIPELATLPYHIEVHEMDKLIDSSNMGIEYWVSIVDVIEKNYERFDGFVVLHGTDTMAYTASALSFLIQNPGKPIILTGAQLPIGVIRSDGRENLITAVEIAGHKENGISTIQEVAIYFENYLYRGNRAEKVDADDFDAFSSFNYPLLCEAGIKLKFNQSALLMTSGKVSFHKKMNNRVGSVRFFPGLLPNVCAQYFKTDVDAIIMETYGSGNLNTDPWLMEQIKEAVDSGKIIINVTQCNGGFVRLGQYETSAILSSMGVVSGMDMTFEAAVTKTMYLLGEYDDKQTVKELISESISGELTEQ